MHNKSLNYKKEERLYSSNLKTIKSPLLTFNKVVTNPKGGHKIMDLQN